MEYSPQNTSRKFLRGLAITALAGGIAVGAGSLAYAGVELTNDKANAYYNSLTKLLKDCYAKSGLAFTKVYQSWERYNKAPYESSTHGGRFVNNFANDVAKAYGKYEESGPMPAGAILVKDSFQVKKGKDGKDKVTPGPMFIMEKMPAGFNASTHDWKYQLITVNGKIFGTTNGKGSKKMKFCADCHNAVAEDQDAMFYLPEEYRN